mgnify:CR=1 FL=1
MATMWMGQLELAPRAAADGVRHVLVLEPVGAQLPPREPVQDEPEKPARAAKGPRK